jgi:hypothetical protein
MQKAATAVTAFQKREKGNSFWPLPYAGANRIRFKGFG